jgi:hypothetical protein
MCNGSDWQQEYDIHRLERKPDSCQTLVFIEHDQPPAAIALNLRWRGSDCVTWVWSWVGSLPFATQFDRRHRLLQICALADALIFDEDGIYHPTPFSDRLASGILKPIKRNCQANANGYCEDRCKRRWLLGCWSPTA